MFVESREGESTSDLFAQVIWASCSYVMDKSWNGQSRPSLETGQIRCFSWMFSLKYTLTFSSAYQKNLIRCRLGGHLELLFVIQMIVSCALFQLCRVWESLKMLLWLHNSSSVSLSSQLSIEGQSWELWSLGSEVTHGICCRNSKKTHQE